LLILVVWGMTGTSSYIPFNLSVRDACILLAFCAYVAYRILTHRDVQRQSHLLGMLLAVNIMWILITYVKHPVGFRMFGATTIGGRPYINIVLALLAFWVIVNLPNSAQTVSRIPLYILAGATAIGLLNVTVYFFPSATLYLYPFYGGVDIGGYARSLGLEGEVIRLAGLRPFGYTLVLVLCAYHDPPTLFNPLRPWFYLLLLGFGAVLASGFRSTFFGITAMVTLASWLHKGWRGFALTMIAIGLLLIVVIAGQGRFYQLPLSMQRSLCFLPGSWSSVVLADAEQSSERRFDWWREVIEQDLIKDWRYGDGFGVLGTDYDTLNLSTTAFDWFTLTGSFHNGPLTSIRYVGVPGLVLFYILMIAAAIYGVKYHGICRGSILEPATIFVTLQLVWVPLEFTFIFGAYDWQVPDHILLIALLLLIVRMIPATAAKTPVPSKAQSAIPKPSIVQVSG
jgi:hypothetical protein